MPPGPLLVLGNVPHQSWSCEACGAAAPVSAPVPTLASACWADATMSWWVLRKPDAAVPARCTAVVPYTAPATLFPLSGAVADTGAVRAVPAVSDGRAYAGPGTTVAAPTTATTQAARSAPRDRGDLMETRISPSNHGVADESAADRITTADEGGAPRRAPDIGPRTAGLRHISQTIDSVISVRSAGRSRYRQMAAKYEL